MKCVRRILCAGLALLLTFSCLCGGISAADAQPKAPLAGQSVFDGIDPGHIEAQASQTIQQTVTLASYSHPGSIMVGSEGVVSVTPASFLSKDGAWYGTSGEFTYVITGISAASQNEKILSVSNVVATDSGWEFSILGLAAGTAGVTLTFEGTVSYDRVAQPLQKTESFNVDVVGSEARQIYVYTESDANGTAFPQRSAVSEDGTVELSFTAKTGYQIEYILIYSESGELIDRLDFSKEAAQSKILRLQDVRETLYIKLQTISSTPGLSNPFRDLKLEDFENPYSDLTTDDWFYEPVALMSMAGMLDGIDFEEYLPKDAQPLASYALTGAAAPTYRVTSLAAKTDTAKKAPTKRLRPKATGTRVVTVMELHNAADNLNLPSGSYTKSPFADVTSGSTCFQAVLWASDKGIVYGYGDGTFGTMDSITREQMCAILLRTAQKAGLTLPESSSAKNFTDAGSVSSWAQSAVTACSRAGIVNGFPDGSFKPKNKIAHSEVVVMIYRFLNLLP